MDILTNISQLATCPDNSDQADIGSIEDAALVWEHGKILWLGKQLDLPAEYQNGYAQDCSGKLVIPGLIDCHTHLCFGGWRGNEFAQRIAGKSYLEIAAGGGGIASTVTATRDASFQDLKQKAAGLLGEMLALGVTTVECKSGYGLDFDNEIKQLKVYAALQQEQAIDLVATFLGAHIIPAEFKDNRTEYIELLIGQLLPEIKQCQLAEFCDCYIDEGAYTLEEGRQILQAAGELGFGLKIHAEQLTHTGAAALAAELGAISAEHLERISSDDQKRLAKAGTVAVSLPLASMYLKDDYIDARSLIQAGVPVAVATDLNPGSSPSGHLPLAMLQACLHQAMSPAEVLKGATSVAAKAIARESTVGSLLPGYQADIAIIDAEGINHWMYHFRANACVGVIKKGVWQHNRL
ncbi:MAG: imidazolonepropionase [Xanthomonadales bacterium]|nr:imidazolonepropionase [Xanthomonadales bacterium]